MRKQTTALVLVGIFALSVAGCNTTQGTLIGAGIGTAAGAAATNSWAGTAAGAAIGAGTGYYLTK